MWRVFRIIFIVHAAKKPAGWCARRASAWILAKFFFDAFATGLRAIVLKRCSEKTNPTLNQKIPETISAIQSMIHFRPVLPCAFGAMLRRHFHKVEALFQRVSMVVRFACKSGRSAWHARAIQEQVLGIRRGTCFFEAYRIIPKLRRNPSSRMFPYSPMIEKSTEKTISDCLAYAEPEFFRLDTESGVRIYLTPMSKGSLIFCLWAGIVLFAALPNGMAANYVIFCSPGLNKIHKNTIALEFQKFVSGGSGKPNEPQVGMKPGDSIQVFDASSMMQIGPETIIPPNARTATLQYQAAADLVRAFLGFLRDETLEAKPLNVPKLVSSYKENVSSSDAKVLIIASPLYYDDVPAHDMREGWLSDGYFGQPPSVTVFSVQHKEKNLRGNTFRICTTLQDQDYGTDNKNAHKDMVRRFWAIYFNKCGGSLVSFQSDIPTAFRSLTREDLDGIPHDFNPDDTEMVVRRSQTELHKVQVEKQPVSDVTYTEVSRSEELISKAAQVQGGKDWISADPTRFNKENEDISALQGFQWKTRIALKWSTDGDFKDVDLDLYVRPRESSHELHFHKTESPEGIHLKDFPADSIAKYGFEIVDLKSSVDPGDLQIWVNAHSGSSSKGFEGEVRILHEGKLAAYPFHIKATTGNKGREANNRNRSSFWASISAN